MVGIFAVQVLPVVFHQANIGHLLQQLLQLLFLHASQLDHLLQGFGLAYAHFQGDIRHLIGDQTGKAPILRVLPRDTVKLGRNPVGDLFAQG